MHVSESTCSQVESQGACNVLVYGSVPKIALNFKCQSKAQVGAVEMEHLLRALAASAEVRGVVRKQLSSVTPVSRDRTPFCGLCSTMCTWCIDIYADSIHTQSKDKSVFKMSQVVPHAFNCLAHSL